MRHDKVGFRREGHHRPRSRCELATSTCQLFRHLAVWGRLDSIGTTIFDTDAEFSLQLSFPSLISVKHIVAPSPVRNSNGTHSMKTTNSDDNSECPRVFSHTRLCDTLNKARLLAFWLAILRRHVAIRQTPTQGFGGLGFLKHSTYENSLVSICLISISTSIRLSSSHNADAI